MQQEEPLVWWNGEIVKESGALVSAVSQGLQWGRGLFETLGIRNGQPFALTRHLERLRAAAVRLNLTIPEDDAWREALSSLLKAQPMETARLRLTVTGGAHHGLSLAPGGEQILIRAVPYEPVTAPASLLTVPWRRNEFGALAGLKATSYAENAVAQRWAHDRDATEAFFLNTGGDLCEGAASNVFLVRDGTLFTPSLSSGCLPGVTRALVMELCEQLGLECTAKALLPDDAAAADAVFLTSSLRGVQAVISWDEHRFPGDSPVTAALVAALDRLRTELPDP